MTEAERAAYEDWRASWVGEGCWAEVVDEDCEEVLRREERGVLEVEDRVLCSCALR